ncbi:head decoration protein [Desulfitobacterium chlororespirans]|uniref:Bacteriophage lambda head decoration protein D n=1 Tax=Desulfitobacterium chlororespirans DSM 11544 TaxID=1121395 RepID=A0A1M7U2X2_9FIRM|nr:head decoration protein [Desulfitobacterium chlororespirans]SHN77305.1 Bacteriophage lambda head decoration protein D [Desulfitobacterium chlororespirans DSM 11544]
MPAYEIDGYDNLIAGMVQPIVTQSIIINQATDAKFERGTVLARTGFTEEGMWVCTIVNSEATPAEEKVPVGVLADEEVDATTAQQRATAYVSGEFNRDALIFGGTDTIATHEAALNAAKIYTKRVVK